MWLPVRGERFMSRARAVFHHRLQNFMAPPSSSVLRNKACMIIAVGGGKKHDSSHLCSTTNYSFAWHADVEMSHHQSVLTTQTWLKIGLFLGPFLLFRMEIGELFDISPVASLLQFRLCPSDTINNWAFVYLAHLNITVNKHFSCDVEIYCPSCLIPAPLIEDTISTVIMALSVWSGQVSVLVCVCVCTHRGMCVLWCVLPVWPCLSAITPLSGNIKIYCHGKMPWLRHSCPSAHTTKTLEWAGFATYACSLHRLRGRADAKTGITTPVGTSGARILGAVKAWLQLWLIAALSVCVFRDVPV